MGVIAPRATALVPASDPTGSSNPSAAPAGPAVVVTIGSHRFAGCYTEATDARALSAKVVEAADMSLDRCATTCAAFRFWGVEYGTEV